MCCHQRIKTDSSYRASHIPTTIHTFGCGGGGLDGGCGGGGALIFEYILGGGGGIIFEGEGGFMLFFPVAFQQKLYPQRLRPNPIMTSTKKMS